MFLSKVYLEAFVLTILNLVMSLKFKFLFLMHRDYNKLVLFVCVILNLHIIGSGDCWCCYR